MMYLASHRSFPSLTLEHAALIDRLQHARSPPDRAIYFFYYFSLSIRLPQLLAELRLSAPQRLVKFRSVTGAN